MENIRERETESTGLWHLRKYFFKFYALLVTRFSFLVQPTRKRRILQGPLPLFYPGATFYVGALSLSEVRQVKAAASAASSVISLFVLHGRRLRREGELSTISSPGSPCST